MNLNKLADIIHRSRASSFVAFCAIFIIAACGQITAVCAPIGWAVVEAMGQAGTTGGGDGRLVVARTAEALKDYAEREEPLTILVEGTLTGGGRIEVASHKSILGIGTTATLTGTELSLNRVSNVIIRNLTISDSVDAIALRESHHVWVDHCDLSNCTDGLLDITHGSDYVTASWTRFSKHNKTLLVNSGTSQPEDAETLHVTIHHCWFDGSDTRNPRVGYGLVHVFNCLYSENNYGIGLHSRGKVLAEQNYFDSVKNPIKQMYREDPASPHHGFCESVGNFFYDCSGTQTDEGISFPANQFYQYDFAIDAANEVPEIVKSSVGPREEIGKQIPMPLLGHGAIEVDVQPELGWTQGLDAKSYKIAFGESNPPGPAIETSKQTFDPGKLKPGTTYYWRVDQVSKSGLVEGDVWQFKTTPAKAWFASPSDGTTYGTTRATLQWRSGAKAKAHRVYLARADEPLKRVAEVDRIVYNVDGLQTEANYRWRVDTVTESGVVQGDEWQFTTRELIKAGSGRVEAESMTLEGSYSTEAIGDASGGRLAASNGRSGSMLYAHQGTDGLYDIALRYFNGKGSSQIQVRVDGELISEWNTGEDSSNDRYLTRTMPKVSIRKGAEIQVDAVWREGDNLARVDWMETTHVKE